MAMEELKAKKSLNYGGRRINEGDVFQAPPSHARVLTITGNADKYVAPRVQAKKPSSRSTKNSAATNAQAYERRDMTPSPATDDLKGAEATTDDGEQQ